MAIQQFYQEAAAVETRLAQLNRVPFDPELDALFKKVHDYYSQAINSCRPDEEKPMTMKHLKIQMLCTLVEQNDFQQALIASVAADGSGSRSTEVIRTGAGRVSINDKHNGDLVGTLADRVSNETIEFKF